MPLMYASGCRRAALLSQLFGATWFVCTAMATHLPRMFESPGATLAAIVRWARSPVQSRCQCSVERDEANRYLRSSAQLRSQTIKDVPRKREWSWRWDLASRGRDEMAFQVKGENGRPGVLRFDLLNGHGISPTPIQTSHY